MKNLEQLTEEFDNYLVEHKLKVTVDYEKTTDDGRVFRFAVKGSGQQLSTTLTVRDELESHAPEGFEDSPCLPDDQRKQGLKQPTRLHGITRFLGGVSDDSRSLEKALAEYEKNTKEFLTMLYKDKPDKGEGYIKIELAKGCETFKREWEHKTSSYQMMLRVFTLEQFKAISKISAKYEALALHNFKQRSK